MTLSDQMLARLGQGDWSKARLSRRGLLRTTFGLSLAGLLAACGGDDDDDDDTATSEPTAPSEDTETTETEEAATDAETEASTDVATEAETETATEAETEAATETSEASESTATEAETSSTAESESSDSAYPVVIEHKYGSTTIEAEPQRVLSLGDSDHDAILALGVNPIAVKLWLGDPETAALPWDRELLDVARPEVLDSPEYDFERIASLEPDLIFALYSAITLEDYETLTNIAPVIAQPGEFVDYGIPWQVQTTTVGKALGKEAEAQQLVEDVEAQFTAAIEANPEIEQASGIVAYTFAPGSYGVYGPQDPRARFLSSLGIEPPQAIVDLVGDAYYAELSEERLNVLQSDVLIWITLGDQATELQNNPLYQQLPIHSEGRDIFPLGDIANALSFSTILSLPYALELFVPMIVAAIDGDPSTTVES